MQPYFLPYIGYYQLIGAVDVFVVYDNIKYTKKGWINRNRILLNGTDSVITIPLKKDSDSLNVVQRRISDDFDYKKLLGLLHAAYAKSAYYANVFPLLERIVGYEDRNLFGYIYNSICRVCEYIGIQTEIRISSEISIDHTLKSQDKVIALCQALGADTYINSIGGVDLYDRDEFRLNGIELSFLQPKPFEYRQYGNEFIPWLSIIDVMMFNLPSVVYDVVGDGFDLT